MFVNDGENTIVIDRADFENYALAGWKAGQARKRSKWMHKGNLEKMVEDQHMTTHLRLGWSFGRVKS